MGQEGEEDMVGPPPPAAEDEEEAHVGPAMPKAKKRKVLEFEQQYLATLPNADMYEKSYMHRDTVTHVVATCTDFLLTGSVDGHLKFWKRLPQGIEFVKDYRSHLGAVDGLRASFDGTLCVTISRDRTVKVYDILNFDMIVMLRLPYTPGCAEWIFKKGEAQARLSISDLNSPDIHVYDVRSGSSDPITTLRLHKHPVSVMRYNAPFDTVISSDTQGFIEYWGGSSPHTPPEPPTVSFTTRFDTDLFHTAKAKAVAKSLEVSKDGQQFAMVCSDSRVRVYRFTSGKLRRVYDESSEAASELQRTGGELFRLEDIDFGRRLAVDKELAGSEGAAAPNAVFDESGNFLLYPTLLGIKVVNLVANKVARILGKVENTERFLSLALFQGAVRKSKGLRGLPTAEMVDKMTQPDPTLVCLAFKKPRFYLFSTREPRDSDDAATGRDVFNEKPSLEDALGAEGDAGASGNVLPRGAVIHTTRGDITIKLFPDECPKTITNFTTHAKNGYYEGVIFHRVIKGFMIQTGDPLGDGTGGESIWGGEFEDEFNKTIRHDRPGILSMANAGPNTNGSQFFITTVPCPWLDNKHTVFGRVVKGMEVVLAIEKTKTDKNDKPYDDIKIVNVENLDNVPG